MGLGLEKILINKVNERWTDQLQLSNRNYYKDSPDVSNTTNRRHSKPLGHDSLQKSE